MTFLSRFPRPLDLATAAAVSVGAVITLLFSDWPGGFFVENGPVEILQLAVLLLAVLFFLRAGYRLAEWPGLAALALACLSALALLREVPRCTSPFYEFGPCIAPDYKDAMYWATSLIALALLASNPALRLRSFGPAAFARLPRFLLRLVPIGALVFALVLSSQLAEAAGLQGGEEVLETLAYLVLMVLGLRFAQVGDDIAARSDRQWQACIRRSHG